MEKFKITCLMCGSENCKIEIDIDHGYVIDEEVTEAVVYAVCDCGNKEFITK